MTSKVKNEGKTDMLRHMMELHYQKKIVLALHRYSAKYREEQMGDKRSTWEQADLGQGALLIILSANKNEKNN